MLFLKTIYKQSMVRIGFWNMTKDGVLRLLNVFSYISQPSRREVSFYCFVCEWCNLFTYFECNRQRHQVICYYSKNKHVVESVYLFNLFIYDRFVAFCDEKKIQINQRVSNFLFSYEINFIGLFWGNCSFLFRWWKFCSRLQESFLLLLKFSIVLLLLRAV